MTHGGSAVGRALAERTLGEAGQLAVFLDAHRAILRATLTAMAEEEVRSRLVPSKTTLLGLVKHATFLQVVWYQEAITGTPRTQLGQPAAADDFFDVTESDTISSASSFLRPVQLGQVGDPGDESDRISPERASHFRTCCRGLGGLWQAARSRVERSRFRGQARTPTVGGDTADAARWCWREVAVQLTVS